MDVNEDTREINYNGDNQCDLHESGHVTLENTMIT